MATSHYNQSVNNGNRVHLKLRAITFSAFLLFVVCSFAFQKQYFLSTSAHSFAAPRDNCSPCKTIVGTGTFSFDNSRASSSNTGAGCAGIVRDVWFCWTAPCSGPVTIKTCSLTSVDTNMAVYNGIACPVTADRLLACNDDFCGLQSSVTFQAIEGNQYLIQIGSAPGASGGPVQFLITCDPPPAVACCLPGGACSNLTAAECLSRGGAPNAIGTTCASNGTVLPPPAEDHLENIVPLRWQPKHQNWNRDANRNFIEDDIDAMNPNSRIDILIALNRIPTKTDLTDFASLGSLGYVSRFISVVQLKGIRVADAIALGQRSQVAHVEFDRPVFTMTDVSIQAMRVQGSTVYNPLTVESAFPTLNGTGVNIAIIDTGVDDGVHSSLPAGCFVGGYDALTDTEGNPDDAIGHGTHVAAIALGRPVTVGTSTFRGVAPAAGLVDIQVFKPSGGTTETTILTALDKCIERRVAWNIGVINMSLGNCANSDGSDAVSQRVNLAVQAGMVVVVAMGNSPNCGVSPGTRLVQAPAAADNAITVQAASYENNVTRVNDAIASAFFLIGPRDSDLDLDSADELKPDVTAHGANDNSLGLAGGVQSAQFNTTNGYVRKTGTSMSAPHVAGLAALAIQCKPTIAPLVCKQLILATAEHRGSTPGWQTDWGFGLVDGFAAIEALKSSPGTDLRFNANCSSPDPLNWSSPDLFPGNPFITEGTTNTINATVFNAGPNNAGAFKVEVGIYDFGNSGAYYNVCTIDVPGLAANQTLTVSCPWMPTVSATSGLVHACLKAQIIYAPDTNASNDCAQHNVNIVATQSPARFKFTVVNPSGEDLAIRIEHDRDNCRSPNGWTILLPDRPFTLRAGDPPRVVEVLLDPGQQHTGAQLVNLRVVGIRLNGGEVSLGGVTIVAQTPNITDCNNNRVDDSIDIQLGRSKDRNSNGIPDECENLCLPPQIICPSDISAITLEPGDMSAVVNYPPPTVTSDCAITGIVCNPPSGSVFPVGVTTVSCTATDAAGNTASCSFRVSLFNVCLQNDNGNSSLFFNSVTGDYVFCCDGSSIAGRGVVTRRGCLISLQRGPNETDRRVSAKIDTCQNSGTASLQLPPGTNRCTITDRNIGNNNCSCSGT